VLYFYCFDSKNENLNTINTVRAQHIIVIPEMRIERHIHGKIREQLSRHPETTINQRKNLLSKLGQLQQQLQQHQLGQHQSITTTPSKPIGGIEIRGISKLGLGNSQNSVRNRKLGLKMRN